MSTRNNDIVMDSHQRENSSLGFLDAGPKQISNEKNDFERDNKVSGSVTARTREEKLQMMNSLLREADQLRNSHEKSKNSGEENLSQSDSFLDLSVPFTFSKPVQLAREFKTEPMIVPSE
jgi:hypothetical protein